MDAVMALACAPVPVAGRNWMWRKMVIDGIRTDPEWKNGDYTTQPKVATQIWADFASIVLMAPLPLQLAAPTATATDKLMSEIAAQATSTFDANDEMYALNASHGYDPSSQLEKISAPLMLLNSADDFINPPELGVADRDIKRVKRGSYVLIPASAQTRGHLTFEFPSLWQQHLGKLLEESQPK